MKIHRISTVIKTLALGTGPGDIYTLLEESGLVIKKDRLGIEIRGWNSMKNGCRNGTKNGVAMV